MSDQPLGPGWWQASDGRYYPPETSPDWSTVGPQDAPPPTDPYATNPNPTGPYGNGTATPPGGPWSGAYPHGPYAYGAAPPSQGTNGLAIDLFTEMGAAVNALPGGEIVPALDRGLLDGAEFNNATSDRLLGFPDVSKVCMLQSFHQNAEQLEITFNKAKFDAQPDKIKAIIENAEEAASADMSWKAVDRYSKDYVEMQTKQNVRFYRTPDSVLQRQLVVYDEAAAKKRPDNPIFKEIEDSQRQFAARTVKWYLDTQVSPRMAYNHYFAKPAGKPATKAEPKKS